MTTKNNVTVNNIDGNILLLTVLFRDINQHWINEINSNGDSFDFDSQDIYKHIIYQIIPITELVEKINPEIQKEERQILLKGLKGSVFENIKLYDLYKKKFNELPRERLLIKEFRNSKYPQSTKDDKSIKDIFICFKETQQRKTYYNSEFYNEVGFLEHNFHEEIYLYSLHIKKQINKNFKNENYFDSNYSMNTDVIFLNMGITHYIHNTFNGLVFEDVTEQELYKSLNLKNTATYIKSKDTRKLLYLFYKLRNIINEKDKDFWLKGVLKEIQVSRKYYDSIYKAVTWKDATDNQKKFVKLIDSLFKEKIEPLLL